MLAAAYNYINPLISNFKNLSNLINKYETELYEFLTKGNLYTVYAPILNHIDLADKGSSMPDVLYFPLEHFLNHKIKNALTA